MSASESPLPRPPGQVLVPAAAVGSLSTLLVIGLHFLGVLDRMNLVIAAAVSQGKLSFPKTVPAWLLWLAAILLALALAFSILCVPGTWRRLVIWITAVMMVASWAPVLGLAAHVPEIAAPFVATLWSGVCALIYAGSHRMACDPFPSNEPHEAR